MEKSCSHISFKRKKKKEKTKKKKQTNKKAGMEVMLRNKEDRELI